MNNPSSRRVPAGVTAAVLVIAIAVVAVITIAATGFGRTSAPADPSPSAPPTASPTVSPDPTVAPTQPEHPPIDGDVIVDLDTATDNDVTVTVRDQTGSVVKAVSGTPGDGMSVRWNDILVRTVDARTISVTWVGLAVDEEVHVDVSSENGGYVIDIVQTGPVPNSDATGYDRELMLTFDEPVAAADVSGGVSFRSAD